MNPNEKFADERRQRIDEFAHDEAFRSLSCDWLEASIGRKYIYNFDWLGRPIIQYTQDMFAVQELIWKVKPDLIIETGIAHGGSLILSASLLTMVEYCEAAEKGVVLDPRRPSRCVIGIDIDIRAHNRAAIEAHPLAGRISLIEGSSISDAVISDVRKQAAPFRNVMVFLDSMHTHDHVLAELEAYSPLVSKGSYCVVFDTFVEDMPKGFFADRPWDVGNNPKTAVRQFLGNHPEFEIDTDMENKLLVTAVPSGFLRRKA